MFFFFPDGIAPQGNVIVYQSDNENITTNVLFKDDTFWMSQKDISNLFNVGVPAISKHLNNIFRDGELNENSVISKMETTASDGKTYAVTFYNLDAIIAVGYRINSKEATKFRIWATNTLREYIVKGFVLNDDMLKNGRQFGKDYFDELLARIKEIRASERRFYQKITDIFAQCSFDYDKDSIEAKQFYATVQNKLHWAITNKTAAEIIAERADHNKPHMGLATWKTAPDGKIISTDVVIAKNYLLQEELSELNNIVSMFLDYAENQARRQNLMSMDDWAYRLDSFLQFNEYDILSNAGKISKKVADNLAKEEFKKYRIIQDREFKSDFDKLATSAMKKK
ncbi:virulence RhuM family protein [Veillonella nakazawae]|uniref:Virulence RhuM family protein n=1 Tax=Veillonella nakazawae TaxID=2682456 RepID=A0AB35HBV6_9FIRM|nr:virulence RhuM family protein [Veillonella nakazawae]MCB8605260.1 virulence RhuM family protein [Veillonella nakazawae]